jgi:hypothetical protein
VAGVGFQRVAVNSAPGLLIRHSLSGNGTYSFEIEADRIRAIFVRNPDKLRGFSRACPEFDRV